METKEKCEICLSVNKYVPENKESFRAYWKNGKDHAKCIHSFYLCECLICLVQAKQIYMGNIKDQKALDEYQQECLDDDKRQGI